MKVNKPNHRGRAKPKPKKSNALLWIVLGLVVTAVAAVVIVLNSASLPKINQALLEKLKPHDRILFRKHTRDDLFKFDSINKITFILKQLDNMGDKSSPIHTHFLPLEFKSDGAGQYRNFHNIENYRLIGVQPIFTEGKSKVGWLIMSYPSTLESKEFISVKEAKTRLVTILNRNLELIDTKFDSLPK